MEEEVNQNSVAAAWTNRARNVVIQRGSFFRSRGNVLIKKADWVKRHISLEAFLNLQSKWNVTECIVWVGVSEEDSVEPPRWVDSWTQFTLLVF